MPEERSPEKESEEKKDHPEPKDELVTTEHSVTINGVQIEYSVTTGRIVLKKEDEEKGEKARASIFFTAYTKKGEGDASKRPITYSFNGGPGSSSVWLHLGMLGPRRVWFDDDGNPSPPPYKLVENEYSILDITDLVFIDPVSTGYSRPVPGEEAKQFHGYKPDVESVGDFIHLYTTRYNRWGSPKFLAGESYGTTRAAGLSGYLQEHHGMNLNGLLLISSILNFGTARFDIGNDLPYILFLPTYTATAFYHKRLSVKLQENLEATLAEVETFALNEYTLALMKGDTLDEKERARIVGKLASYTGLSKQYIEQTNLRINIHRFCKELLRDERKTVGRLDSRYTGVDRDAAGEYNEDDPSYSAIQGPYTATFNDYIRRELKFERDLPYEILGSLYQTWKFEDHQNQYLNVGETLRHAIAINPSLRVFVANGYNDLATPYLATKYTFDHLQLEAHLRDNIEMGFYPAGHMMYLHLPSLAQLKKDISAFLKKALGK